MFNKLLNNNHIRRCFELALLGNGLVSPNPIVGCVIADESGIIGEGWHRQYGKEHAEINALRSISTKNAARIAGATLFVSLEPCSIHGKTPPCTAAIIKHDLKHVVVSARDQTPGVKGASEQALKAAHLDTTYGILSPLGNYIAAFRNTYISKKRPYIILKWAQSEDGYMGVKNERTKITNAFTDRYVHRMRSSVDAVLIGSNTLKEDDPALTTRLHSGNDALRIILAPNVSINDSYQILQDDKATLLFSKNPTESKGNKENIKLNGPSESYLEQIMESLFHRKITSLLVEGGADTLGRFIHKNLWDECRILSNQTKLGKGIVAPVLPENYLAQKFDIVNDRIQIRLNPSHPYLAL